MRLHDLEFQGEPLVLRLPESHVLRVRALDATTREELDSQVHVIGTAGMGAGTFGEPWYADGTLVTRRLAPGRYRVTVRCRGYARSCVEDVPVPGPELVVEMRKAVELRGRLVHDDPGRLVVQYFVPNDHVHRSRTSEDGAFVIRGLPDEPGSLYVFDPKTDDAALIENLRPSAGDVEVRLHPSVAFACHLRWRFANPGHGVCVYLHRGPLRLRARNHGGGWFKALAVPAGTYRLSISVGGREVADLGEVDAAGPNLAFDVPGDAATGR